MSTTLVERPAVETNRLAGAWSEPTWRALGYLALGPLAAVAALVTFILVVALGVTGSALIIGIPVLLPLLAISRGVATLERRRAGLVLGAPVDAPYPVVEGSLLKRVVRWVSAPATWRDLAHHALALPLNLATFVTAVAVWGAGLGAISFWAWYWAMPNDQIEIFGSNSGPFVVNSVASAIPWVGIGLAICWVAGWLTRGLARMNSLWTHLLLGR